MVTNMERMLHPVNDALELLSMGRTHFYSEVAAGRIIVIKSGKKTLVPQRALDAYIEARMAEAQAGRAA